MRITDLVDIENIKESIPSTKDRFIKYISKVNSVFESYKTNTNLTKDDIQNIDFIQDVMKAMIKDHNEKKIISGN